MNISKTLTIIFLIASIPLIAETNPAPDHSFVPVIAQIDRPGLETALRPCFEMTNPQRRELAIATIKEYSEAAQGPVLAELEILASQGLVENIEPHWLGGNIVFDGTAEAINQIAARPDVLAIIKDTPSKVIEFDSNPWNRERPLSPAEPTAITWAIDHVNADDAWALGYTGTGVIVCILDSGVRYTHYDLANRMWYNTGETSGNGTDDDMNGYVDDYYGYDFVNSDGDPWDDAGHGTNCAGLVAGDGTSGTETGMAPGANIMAVKVIDASGMGYPSDIFYGLEYGLLMGAQVFSVSLGWDYPGDTLKTWFRGLFEDVLAAGVPVATSAGNGAGGGSHYPIPHDIGAPADGPSPSQSGASSNTAIISVGATYEFDIIANFSSRGPTEWDTYAYSDFPWPPGLIKPEISAPGNDVRTTSYSTDYTYTDFSGTSASAPVVAGGIALALSKNPGLTPEGIDTLLRNTAWDRGPAGHDTAYGAGILDCEQLILATPLPTYPILSVESYELNDDPPVGDGSGGFDCGEEVRLLLDVRNVGASALVTGTASSLGDPYVTVTDASASWGTINTGETKDNTSNPFLIEASSSAPPAYAADIEITLTGMSSTYVETVTVNVGVYPREYAHHETPTTKASVTNFGAFGFFDPQAATPVGHGFSYYDNNTLYSGSFFLGFAYDNVVTGENGNASEFVPLTSITTNTEPWGTENYSWFGDPNTSVIILQKSLSFPSSPNDDFVLLKATVKNKGASTRTNMYIGFYLDFDIHYDSGTWYDRGFFDTGNEWGYMWDEGSTPVFDGYVGLVGLTGISHGSMVENDVYVYPDGGGMGWEDTVKYNFLSGTFFDSDGSPAEDWSIIASEGPFNLAPDEQLIWAVAVVAGDNLTDWQNNAAAARAAYISMSVAENRVPEKTSLDIYPNPFNAACRIIIKPTGNSPIENIEIFDISGRLIRKIPVESTNSSKNIRDAVYEIFWDGKDSEGRESPGGIYLIKTCPGKTARKAVLIR